MGVRSPRRPILVVDDELEMRIFISNLLNANGFESMDIADARVALQRARQQLPALIILNAMMAGGAGLQLYRRFKQDSKLKEVPVLMLSSIESRTLFFYRKRPHTASDFRLPKPEGFLIKPPEGEELLGLVHRLAGSHRPAGASIPLQGI